MGAEPLQLTLAPFADALSLLLEGVLVAFIVTGVVAMLATILQQRPNRKQLLRNNVTGSKRPSIADATALMINLIDVAALRLLIL